MTLRLRLILLLVGIVAAGLLISDVVTYNVLRAFLITRVDQQLEVATFPVGRALASASGLGPSITAAPPSGATNPEGTRRGRTSLGPRSDLGCSARLAREIRFETGGFLPTGRAPLPVACSVPPGTYGQLRSSSGKIEAHLFFSYGEKAPSAPGLPGRLAGVGGLRSFRPRPLSIEHGSGTPLPYRVLAKPLLDTAPAPSSSPYL